MAVLCALMGFASISTDFYLPAMPTMAHAFGVGPGTMELTIAAYLVGLSGGQLFWGRWVTVMGARGRSPLGWCCS
jgi:DHA1 family bicyclomycin/chloramphenicol resistance-like MFS transporter